MKTEIDLSTIESALIKLGDASARDIANETGLEAKDVTRSLNDMRTAAAVEREKRGSEYVYWLTTSATVKPTMKPKAAAVAVQALHTPGSPADITEQQRLDVAAVQTAPACITPAIQSVEHIEAGPSTPAALPKKSREQQKPTAKQHSPAEIAHAKYNAELIDTLRANPPLLLAGPLLHILARCISNNQQEYGSDGEAVTVIIGELIEYCQSVNRPGNTLEDLAKALSIDAAAIFDKHSPQSTSNSDNEKPTAKPTADIRFRHPENNEITWSGKGRKPQWVTHWLAQGNDISEIAVQHKEAA